MSVFMSETLYLLRDIFEYKVVKIASNERAVRLDDDAVLATVFDYRLLLAEWMQLRRYQ